MSVTVGRSCGCKYADGTWVHTCEQHQARRVCAWCQRDLGPAGPDYDGDTHGMCKRCKRRMLAQVTVGEEGD